MGYEEVPGLQYKIFTDLGAGWFPNRNFYDVPGNYNSPDEPVGMIDGDNVIWHEGQLNKLFGYASVTTSALNGDVTSLFYSKVLGKVIGTAGTKFYEELDTATPTDRTGAVTLTTAKQVHWSDWQYKTTSFAVGVNGTDVPIKWSGSGNAAVLAGSPPTGRWVAHFQNALWLGNITSNTSQVRFSNLGDAEVWTSTDNYNFDAAITGMAVLGDKLVVFKDYSIGILVGGNNRIMTKIDRYINGVGCSGGHTITPAKFQGIDVLIFHAYDGIYIFDGSTTVTKISGPINQKYISGTAGDRWNEDRFDNAWAAYSHAYGWYILSLSDSSDSQNNFIVIADLKRPMQGKDGPFVPLWPADSVNANCIIVAATSALVEGIYFGGTTVDKVFKFNPTLYSREGVAYEGKFRSKTMDLISSWILQELNILGPIQTTTITGAIAADLETGDGEFTSISLDSSAIGLDSFILDTDILGGGGDIYGSMIVDIFGRFLNFTLKNSTLNEGMTVDAVTLALQQTGINPMGV